MSIKYLSKSGATWLISKIKFALSGKVDKVDGKGLSTNDYTTAEKNKLAGIAEGAEVNQNAFSNVTVGSTTVAADSTTDTLTLVAGSNVSITPDATNDKITISATVPTKVSQLTNDSGYKTTDNNTTYSISKSGSTITLTGSDGSTSTVSDANTTYGAATTSAAGLMSASDKSKLDGITASADAVSFSRSLTSGTKVGTLTINGTGTDLYAPTNTDTHYTTGLKVGASNTATANAAASNGSVYLNVLDNSTVRDSHKITGSGATSVTSDANGVITISSTNTTYNTATTSANGLMSSGDKSKLDGIATGATKVVVDSSLSTSSANPVQNKLVTTEINSLKTLVGNTSVSSQISTAIAKKSDTGHTHDDRYYTESEIDTKISTLNQLVAQKSDVLTLEEIQASTDLSGKIASASAIDTLLSKLSGLSFEFVGHGVDSGHNERRPYFDFSTMPYGIYLVFNTNHNIDSGLGAITWLVYDGDLQYLVSKDNNYEIFSNNGKILYGQSRSWECKLSVYRVYFNVKV